jgi:enoyl-CoA hydratase/carnithine racemase
LSIFSEIGKAFRELGDDPDCRAIVMSGNGKMFCSGTFLKV